MATIEIDTSVWKNKLAQLKVATGESMTEVLNEEWPLLMAKIVELTPPRTLAQGRAAVGRDIEKTMRPFDPSTIRDKGIQKVVAERNIQAFNTIVGRIKAGPLRGARAVAFSPDIHFAAKNANGRVGRNLNQVVLGPDAGLLKKYIAMVQGLVGWAKAGWLPAIRLLGGDAPSFVGRHEPGHGSVIDDRTNPDNPSVTAINRTPWAARRDEGQRIIQDAYNSRAVAIFAKVKTKIRLAIGKAHFDLAS
jgi:hypothetical protein